MKDLIMEYNVEKVVKELGSLEGKNIMVNDIWLTKVKDIVIEYIPFDENIPDELRDGSEENTISIDFNFTDGKVSATFCPEHEVCEVWHETDELIVFRIQDKKNYIQHEQDCLEFMEREYTKHMSQ